MAADATAPPGAAAGAPPDLHLFLLTATTSAALLLVWLYRAWKRHPLYGRNIPVVYPLLGCMPQILANKDRILEWATEQLQASPTHTIRSVRPEGTVMLMTANPANVEHVLLRRFDNYPKGELFCGLVRDLLGRGIFSADGALWRTQRKVASHEFTTRSLRELVVRSLQAETRRRAVPALDDAAASGGVVDLQELLMRLALGSVCRVAFGVEEVEADLEGALEAGFARAFDVATALSSARFLAASPVVWKVKRALNVGSERRLKEAIAVVHGFAASVIRARRKQLAADPDGITPDRQRQDLLSRFMRLVESEQQSEEARELEATWRSSTPDKAKQQQRQHSESTSSSSFSDEFLRDIVISFVLAGRDTTSVALSWFFWLLCRHPAVEAAIMAEIRDVLAARPPPSSATDPDDDDVVLLTYDELRGMHYLTAALSESLRLYPPVPVDTKTAQSEDVLPDGTRVPRGVRVGYHPYAMARLESLWGPDCLDYRPDRWLADHGRFQAPSPFKFPVFQAGPRVCLGKDMAMLQLKFVAAALVARFQFALQPEGYCPTYRLSFTIPMRDGLPVRLRRRRPPLAAGLGLAASN